MRGRRTRIWKATILPYDPSLFLPPESVEGFSGNPVAGRLPGRHYASEIDIDRHFTGGNWQGQIGCQFRADWEFRYHLEITSPPKSAIRRINLRFPLRRAHSQPFLDAQRICAVQNPPILTLAKETRGDLLRCSTLAGGE
jgi:hypothetical protein